MTKKAIREKRKNIPCDTCAAATTCEWSCDLFYLWAEDMTSEEASDAAFARKKRRSARKEDMR